MPGNVKSEADFRAEENRMSEASEPYLTVQVLAGSPVSWRGTVYYAGQQLQMLYSAANRLVAQGRVSIVP